MAGSYPDPPGPRIMYDTDGTGLYWAYDTGGVVGGAITPLTAANLAPMNDYDDDAWVGGGVDNWALIIIFPVTMDISAYHYAARIGWSTASYGPTAIESSVDTTNGVDGTWVTVASSVAGNATTTISPAYRTSITTLTASGIKALRFRNFRQYQQVRALHLYGQPTSATNDILAFWSPGTDTALPAAALDFGDVPQGNTSSRTFRIKNLSAALTANTITISDSTPSDFTPSVPPQYEYSLDGTTFSQSLSIGNLAAGAISSVITARKTTPSNAALGLHTVTVQAQATSWS